MHPETLLNSIFNSIVYRFFCISFVTIMLSVNNCSFIPLFLITVLPPVLHCPTELPVKMEMLYICGRWQALVTCAY